MSYIPSYICGQSIIFFMIFFIYECQPQHPVKTFYDLLIYGKNLNKIEKQNSCYDTTLWQKRCDFVLPSLLLEHILVFTFNYHLMFYIMNMLMLVLKNIIILICSTHYTLLSHSSRRDCALIDYPLIVPMSQWPMSIKVRKISDILYI